MAIKNRPVKQICYFIPTEVCSMPVQILREQLKGLPVLQSMSRKGNCWDNAVAESFFKTLENRVSLPY
jgi:putative transposase